jgi:hypothetical protein
MEEQLLAEASKAYATFEELIFARTAEKTPGSHRYQKNTLRARQPLGINQIPASRHRISIKNHNAMLQLFESSDTYQS